MVGKTTKKREKSRHKKKHSENENDQKKIASNKKKCRVKNSSTGKMAENLKSKKMVGKKNSENKKCW